jgi:hypothetical protein
VLQRHLHLDDKRPHFDVETQIVEVRTRDTAQIGSRPNPGSAGKGLAQIVTTDLKTAASYRVLYCNPVMEMILRNRLAALPGLRASAKSWDDRYDLVFTTGLGSPISYTAVKRVHQRICKLAGLDRRITLHGLRHTGLSLLMAANVPLTEIQAIAGHASLKELAEVYLHVMGDKAARGAETMGALLPLMHPVSLADGEGTASAASADKPAASGAQPPLQILPSLAAGSRRRARSA